MHRVAAATDQDSALPALRCAVVVRVREDGCDLMRAGQRSAAGFARAFPAPRAARVSPGHLVALASGADGRQLIVWRWYDAVVVAAADGLIELWEPAHGEVTARARYGEQRWDPGTRAYLSAGLPGAAWWVEGPAVAAETAATAEVELDEVARFCAEHGIWPEAG